MSDAKHTPGPWVVWADTNLVIRLHSGAARSEDLRICEVSTNTRNDEGRHNARLIAAAPTLLERLEEALEFIEDHVDVSDGPDGAPRPNRAMQLAEPIRSAIAAAKGEGA